MSVGVEVERAELVVVFQQDFVSRNPGSRDDLEEWPGRQHEKV